MKNLFSFLIAMFISVVGFSQATGLIVENQTPCMQYYQIFGDEVCRCGTRYSGNVISIPPGGVHTYSGTTSLGNTYPPATTKGMVGARIFDGSPACQSNSGTVGEPACGLPPTYTYIALNQDCRECTRTTARWIPAPHCTSEARLVFTP